MPASVGTDSRQSDQKSITRRGACNCCWWRNSGLRYLYTPHQWRIQNFGIGGGAEKVRVGLREGAIFWQFYAKIMHFGATFSLVLRCIQSIGKRLPPLPWICHCTALLIVNLWPITPALLGCIQASQINAWF